jgi:hypothetical protein
MVERKQNLLSKVPQPNINHRYELKDVNMASDKIPFAFKREDVAYYDYDNDYDGGWCWKAEFSHLSSLYNEVSDEQPNILEEVEFEIVDIVKMDSIKKMSGFSYPTQSKNNRTITEVDAKHQMIDEIVFPSLVLPSTPCKLSQKDSYDIVRACIQDNINPKHAQITSNYDFCFTVKKKIPLFKHEPYEVDLNAYKRTKQKNLETRYRKERMVEIFQMCHKPYQGYTPIEPFEGKNQNDLKKNIDKFLKVILAEINTPLQDCPNCNGMGVVNEGDA